MDEKTIRKEERDHFTVVLEDIRSNFKIFGEVLGGVSDKLDRVEKKGDATFEEVGKILLRFGNIENEIKS